MKSTDNRQRAAKHRAREEEEDSLKTGIRLMPKISDYHWTFVDILVFNETKKL